MGKTIKDMPYHVRAAYHNKIKITKYDLDTLSRRVPWRLRIYESDRYWKMIDHYDEVHNRIHPKEGWNWRWYASTAPKWYRRDIKKGRKMKERMLIAAERYDEIPDKYHNDAAYLYW